MQPEVPTPLIKKRPYLAPPPEEKPKDPYGYWVSAAVVLSFMVIGVALLSSGSAAPQSAQPQPGISDERVNALDLSILLAHDAENYPPADYNHDGVVNGADTAIVLSRWTW
ncbi:MAG TPA: hypothetical protein VF572_00025 [Candidatus Saccharimonadales bacterium]|jgi:hypothetical protein